MIVNVATSTGSDPVDAARAGHHWSLIIGRRSYEVAVDARPDGLIVHVNGRAVTVPMQTWRARARAGVTDHAAGPKRVVAPMPGRVLKVLVKVGDIVTARQGLVVVEAMKMENELRAPAAGTVVAIRAVEGALVDANAVLVVLELFLESSATPSRRRRDASFAASWPPRP